MRPGCFTPAWSESGGGRGKEGELLLLWPFIGGLSELSGTSLDSSWDSLTAMVGWDVG